MIYSKKKFFIFLTTLLTIFLFCDFVLAQGLPLMKSSGGANIYMKAGKTAAVGGFSESSDTINVWATDTPLELVSTILKVLMSFLGVIFMVLVLYGGFLWMTAAGNEDQITKAKGLIKNGIIGLVIVLASYAITYFVFYALTRTTNYNTGINING